MNKIIDLVLVFSMLFLLFSFAIRTNAEQGNPFEQSVKVRCTCYVTSGTTAKEVIHTVKDLGGEPTCVTVLIDKAGLSEIEGIPVESLIKVSRL